MSDKIGEKSFLKKCEASLVDKELQKEPGKRADWESVKKHEKKCFISHRFQCIIKLLVKSFVMSFKSNSVQVICLSVLGFCAGVFLTCILITARRPDSRHGVGGLETSAEPEYSENLSTLLAEVEKDVKASDSASLTEKSFVPAAVGEAADDINVDDLLAIGADAPNADAAAESSGGAVSSIVTYQTYRVKSGDMIGFIADAFDVTQDTIISVNNIKQSRLIQPGQYLKIPSMAGIIYTVKKNGETAASIAEKYKVNAEKCANANYVSLDTELKAGTSLFVPDAELDWATRQEINGDLFKKPLHARYWLSSNYGWRDSPFNAGSRTFHGGIDMAVSQGTPIYAALDGTVTAVGYNATYGNYVIITHHSGYKTLYGHMKSTACRKGNFVYTNTVIGYVGSTGMSTGPHLHFTVYKNGKTINPLTVLN